MYYTMNQYKHLDFFVNNTLMTEEGKISFICDFNNAVTLQPDTNFYKFSNYPLTYTVTIHPTCINVSIE
jgi:hypothetical protein